MVNADSSSYLTAQRGSADYFFLETCFSPGFHNAAFSGLFCRVSFGRFSSPSPINVGGAQGLVLGTLPIFINPSLIPFALMELNATCLSLGPPRSRTLIKGLHADSLYRNEILESRREGQGEKNREEREPSSRMRG